MRRMTFVAFAWLSQSATTFAEPTVDPATATLQVQPAADAQLAVTFLANEAFHVSDGEHAVLLDAFVMQTYLQYGALQPATWRALVDAESPFERIDLALVSHVHRDHHQPAASHEFLEKRPDVPVVTSKQVWTATKTKSLGPGMGESAHAMVEVDAGEVTRREFDGFTVDFFGLPHGGRRHVNIENLGHLIDFGDFRVLHVGDADLREDVFAPLNLPARDIDVALLPYWFFEDGAHSRPVEAGAAARWVRQYVGADWYVPCHIPRQDQVTWSPAAAPEGKSDLPLRIPRQADETLLFPAR